MSPAKVPWKGTGQTRDENADPMQQKLRPSLSSYSVTSLCKTKESHHDNNEREGHGPHARNRVPGGALPPAAGRLGRVDLLDGVGAELPVEIGHDGLRVAHGYADFARVVGP